jgi:hypothetical protein
MFATTWTYLKANGKEAAMLYSRSMRCMAKWEEATIEELIWVEW